MEKIKKLAINFGKLIIMSFLLLYLFEEKFSLLNILAMMIILGIYCGIIYVVFCIVVPKGLEKIFEHKHKIPGIHLLGFIWPILVLCLSYHTFCDAFTEDPVPVVESACAGFVEIEKEWHFGVRSRLVFDRYLIILSDGKEYAIESTVARAFHKTQFEEDVKAGEEVKIVYEKYSDIGRYYATEIEVDGKQYIDTQKRQELLERSERMELPAAIILLLIGLCWCGLRIWIIYKEKYDAKEALRFTIYQRTKLLQTEKCGCFSCIKIFTPKDIKDWTDNEKTAVCPYCRNKTVLGDNFGYPVNEKFLIKMKNLKCKK